MNSTLWFIAAIVVSFCAYTLAVFLLPNDANDDRRLSDIDRLSDHEFFERVDKRGRFR